MSATVCLRANGHGLVITGFKTCLSKTKTETRTQQFQDQDQELDVQDQYRYIRHKDQYWDGL